MFLEILFSFFFFLLLLNKIYKIASIYGMILWKILNVILCFSLLSWFLNKILKIYLLYIRKLVTSHGLLWYCSMQCFLWEIWFKRLLFWENSSFWDSFSFGWRNEYISYSSSSEKMNDLVKSQSAVCGGGGNL